MAPCDQAAELEVKVHISGRYKKKKIISNNYLLKKTYYLNSNSNKYKFYVLVILKVNFVTNLPCYCMFQ